MDGDRKDRSNNVDLPADRQIKNRMADLAARGVTVEAECVCGATTEATALPGESVDVTICRSCATDHLRENGLL